MVDAATEHSKPCNKQVTKNACSMYSFFKNKRNSLKVYNFFFMFFLLESAEPSQRLSINPLLKSKVHISATGSKLVLINEVKCVHAALPESCGHFQGNKTTFSTTGQYFLTSTQISGLCLLLGQRLNLLSDPALCTMKPCILFN